MTSFAQWQNSRKVARRILISGKLELTTPAHFGGIADVSLADISIQRSSSDSSIPLLTGASIAGALRNYLREATLGYGVEENQDGQTLSEQLFGYVDRANEASYESWLFISDALGEIPMAGDAVELRDFVAINSASRIAEVKDGKGKKFDAELLAAGTVFRIQMELWVPQKDESLKTDPMRLIEALAMALDGLENGQIGLGLRKRRGFGQCKVSGWHVQNLDMGKVTDILTWLQPVSQDENFQQCIFNLLGVANRPTHKGIYFNMDAPFSLQDRSLLIRSSSGQPESSAMVHLRSYRNGIPQPIVSGTSVAGALRSRAWRIARKFKGDDDGRQMIDAMFGKRIRSSTDVPSSSCLIVKETQIEEGGIQNLIQNRVKIDRFTGGAYPQALFTQQPFFGGDINPATVRVKLELRQTADTIRDFDAQIGLLLLLLKDLWTGDLPLGGESSNGRGVLHGEHADLKLGNTNWFIKNITDQNGASRLSISENISTLEDVYLRAFHEWYPKKESKS